MRQGPVLTEYDPKPGLAVATLAYDYRSGHRVQNHAHGSDQLIYAVSGLMEVASQEGVWLIPPHFCLWIPRLVQHQIRMLGPVSMRTLYLRPSLVPQMRRGCAVLHVSPLLRELILETVRIGALRKRNRYQSALCQVLTAAMLMATPVPTFIRVPSDARALILARILLKNPAEPRSLAALCLEAGSSVRTMERAFRKDVGITFESWRKQVRLIRAVELMLSGHSMKEVAFRIGYAQPGTFVEVFRRTFGDTPKAWLSALQKLGA